MRTKQHGGEGKGSYSGKKSNMFGLGKQHGGEGKNLSTKNGGSSLNLGMSGEAYCGPGRYLSTQS